MMNYREICDTLTHSGIGDAGYEAALLIYHFCGIPYEKLLLCKNEDFVSDELNLAVKKRCTHYPLQYIIGEWEFYGRNFKVTEDTLIPRQDTETLIPVALGRIKQNCIFADIGTGSGCIALTLLAERRDLNAVCVDISKEALAVCRENAERLGVDHRCRFVLGDMRNDETRKNVGNIDCLISNPPYIPTKDVDNLAPEVGHEPRTALDGGRDGLDFYRCLITEWYDQVDNCFIFENGIGQSDDIIKIGKTYGLTGTTVFDIEKRDRVTVMEK